MTPQLSPSICPMACDCWHGHRADGDRWRWRYDNAQTWDYDDTYCPRLTITAFSYRMLELAHRYDSGFLPHEGGVDDQPALLLQAIDIVRQRQSVHQKRSLEKARGT